MKQDRQCKINWLGRIWLGNLKKQQDTLAQSGNIPGITTTGFGLRPLGQSGIKLLGQSGIKHMDFKLLGQSGINKFLGLNLLGLNKLLHRVFGFGEEVVIYPVAYEC